MDNIIPKVDRPDWGNLPTEILKMVFENLGYEHYLQYQLVNKQWYFASLGVAYRDITIDNDLTNDHRNWKRLDSFCSLLKNPSYNIGHYIKELAFESINNNFYIVGLTMEHCPNVEKIYVTPTKLLNKYIASAQKNDVIVWSKLREVVKFTGYNNNYYRLMYLFRNSVQNVCLSSTPSIPTNDESDSEGEQTSGTVYAYLKEFKSLKSLEFVVNFMNYCLLDCEMLLQHCSATLDELDLNLNSSNNRQDDRPANILSLSQTQLQATYAYKPFPGLKKLVLRNYTPQSALLEFMYMKHKFVNLEEIEIHHKYGLFWEPLSPLIIDIITEYVFNIPKFELCISSRINLKVVQRFFESYMKRVEKRYLMIDFSSERDQGIKFTNNKNEWPTANTPQMHISINQSRLLLLPVDLQAIEEFKKLLKYAGPYLQALKLGRVERYIVHEAINREDSFDAELIDEILSACPNLQELVLNMGGHLERCKVEKEPHAKLQTIEFEEDTQFEDGFFLALATRLPNVHSMTVLIAGEDKNQLQPDHINMPFTNFTKLTVDLTDVTLGTNYVEEEKIVVSITTKNEENNIGQYYQCCIPADNTDDYYSRTKLKFTLMKIPPKTDTTIFRLTCSTIKLFILESAPYKCILNF